MISTFMRETDPKMVLFGMLPVNYNSIQLAEFQQRTRTSAALLSSLSTRVMDVPQICQLELQDRLRRSNELHSPIYILPTEILSRIFFYTCLKVPLPGNGSTDWICFDPVDRQIFTLTSVSSFWRQTALATPDLWSTVTLAPSGESCIPYSALLQHYLVHAGALDITITLNFSACTFFTSDPARPMFKSISEVLLTPLNLRKITTLKLLRAPSPWMQSMLPRLISIRSLVIAGYFNEFPNSANLDLRGLTELRQLSLTGMPWKSIDFPPTIQTLRLTSTTSTFNVAALYQCPDLVEYHEYYPWDPPIGQIPSALFLTPLTLPNLRTMTWSINSSIRARDRSLHNLQLPALKTLYLRDYPNVTPTVIADFCRQLTSITTLSSLGLIDFEDDFDEEYFRTLFSQSASGIQTLGVLDREEAAEAAENALRALTPQTGESDREVLPQLRKIVIDLGTNPQNPELLLNMVKKRRLGDDVTFLIELLDVDYYLWTTTLHEHLSHTMADHRIQFSRGRREVWSLDDCNAKQPENI